MYWSVIVVLQDHDQSYKYWPELSQVLHFADILIETNAEKTMGGYVMIEISITNSKVRWPTTVTSCKQLYVLYILTVW